MELKNSWYLTTDLYQFLFESGLFFLTLCKPAQEMKRLLVIVLIIASCKSKRHATQELTHVNSLTSITSCALTGLQKTVNYKSELKRLKKIYKDTVIELEYFKHEGYGYTTVFDLRLSSHFLWLLSDLEGQKTDSVLIDALSDSKLVETYFNIGTCELERMVAEFHDNGDPKTDYSTIIKLGK